MLHSWHHTACPSAEEAATHVTVFNNGCCVHCSSPPSPSDGFKVQGLGQHDLPSGTYKERRFFSFDSLVGRELSLLSSILLPGSTHTRCGATEWRCSKGTNDPSSRQPLMVGNVDLTSALISMVASS